MLGPTWGEVLAEGGKNVVTTAELSPGIRKQKLAFTCRFANKALSAQGVDTGPRRAAKSVETKTHTEGK